MQQVKKDTAKDTAIKAESRNCVTDRNVMPSIYAY